MTNKWGVEGDPTRGVGSNQIEGFDTVDISDVLATQPDPDEYGGLELEPLAFRRRGYRRWSAR